MRRTRGRAGDLTIPLRLRGGHPGSARPVAVRAGTTVSGWLDVPDGIDPGTAIPLSVVRGTRPGPVLALVAGTFALPAGRIEAPMGRSPRERTRMGVVSGGREAVTEFKVLERFGSSTLIEVHLGTGRTHQIRVHLAHIRHPVVGDAVYGKAANALARQLGLTRPFLHSHRLQFVHPVTGAAIDIVEPLPPDLAAVLHSLEADR